MKRVGVLILVALLTVACSSDPSTVDSEDTTTSSPDPDGYTFGNIRCESDLFEFSISDYGSDAVGYDTIEEAIEAFRNDDTWRLREDWHELTQGDMSSSPVKFTDQRGWVYLSVDLERFNDSWLISGYASCPPPDL